MLQVPCLFHQRLRLEYRINRFFKSRLRPYKWALNAALTGAPRLMHLYLEGNLLSGPLPSMTGAGGGGSAGGSAGGPPSADSTLLTACRVLNLARNRIAGSVPTDLATLPVFRATAAQVQTGGGTQVLVHSLDLSNNLLDGAGPCNRVLNLFQLNSSTVEGFFIWGQGPSG